MINKIKLKKCQTISRFKKYFFLILIMSTLITVSYFILNHIFYSIVLAMCPIFLAVLIQPATKEIIKMTSAHFVSDQSNPLLVHTIENLALKARLESCPKSYLIDTYKINAFTSGEGNNTIICVTEGVLEKLAPNELEAVLAHEIAHLKENDMFYLKLVQIIYAFTSFISTIINLTVLLALPLLLFGLIKVNLLPLIIIIISPNVLRLFIMAYMRNREFAADENAVAMTKNPKALVCALKKLTLPGMSFIDLIFPRKRAFNLQSMFETHPSPEQRIRKLIDLDY